MEQHSRWWVENDSGQSEHMSWVTVACFLWIYGRPSRAHNAYLSIPLQCRGNAIAFSSMIDNHHCQQVEAELSLSKSDSPCFPHSNEPMADSDSSSKLTMQNMQGYWKFLPPMSFFFLNGAAAI